MKRFISILKKLIGSKYYIILILLNKMSPKEAKALAKKLAEERRKYRIDLGYVRDALTCARSGNLNCRASTRTILQAILNLQVFFLKPLLEEIRAFLDEFNQGRFSAEFCIIWTLAGRPMDLIVLH